MSAQCLAELGGKDFVFQIRVTPFNFTPSHRTFTVSAILDNITPEVFYLIVNSTLKLTHVRITKIKLFGRLSKPMKLKLKVVNHRHLPALRVLLKAMHQIHQVVESMKLAVNAHVSEVKKLQQRQPCTVFVSFIFLAFPAFPISRLRT